MNELSSEAKGLLLAFEVGVEDGEPQRMRRRLEQYIGHLETSNASLQQRVDAMLAVAKDGVALIDADERHHYEPALVQVNAPLALIQVGLDAAKRAWTAVLAAAQDNAPPAEDAAVASEEQRS